MHRQVIVAQALLDSQTPVMDLVAKAEPNAEIVVVAVEGAEEVPVVEVVVRVVDASSIEEVAVTEGGTHVFFGYSTCALSTFFFCFLEEPSAHTWQGLFRRHEHQCGVTMLQVIQTLSGRH